MLKSQKNNYAGFWIRFAAGSIDTIILLITTYALSLVVPRSALSVVAILYYTLFLSSQYQATPGMIALELKITDLHGKRISFLRAIGRYFASILSVLILYIGYIMIAFTKKKQGLHDMIAGTYVLRK